MIRSLAWLPAVAAVTALPLHAQSLQRRLFDAARDGGGNSVQFSFASRPGVCGDGARFLSDGLGDDNRYYEDGNSYGWRSGDDREDCEPGPVRVVVTVDDGQITRLRTYAGPIRRTSNEDRRDLGITATRDAVDFLTSLVEQARGRASSDAILPMVLADSVDPWPTLLGFARDEHLPRSVRSTTAFWLSRGAGAVLGVNGHNESADDEVRAQAVFALSQQPRESAVPRLIEVVQHSSRPAVRAQALFWLGQSGDPRAIDLFDEILRRR